MTNKQMDTNGTLEGEGLLQTGQSCQTFRLFTLFTFYSNQQLTLTIKYPKMPDHLSVITASYWPAFLRNIYILDSLEKPHCTVLNMALNNHMHV